MLSTATGDILSNQVMGLVYSLYPNIDAELLQLGLSRLISQYDVRPSKLGEGNPDLHQKITLFLEGKRLEGLSPVTLASYLIELRTFSRYIQKPAADITTTDIRYFLSQWESLKTSSLSKKLSVLKSFFSWLNTEEIVTKDPTRRIKPPKKEKRLPKSLSVEELELLREACRTRRERAVVEVLYSTGCRLSEVLNLNKEDINYQSMSTRVIGKGNKEREVFFSHKALFHLKKYFIQRKDMSQALFSTERQPYERLSSRGLQREIKVIAARAGLTKSVYPHIFRHTFATDLLNNGAELSTVQALLGHEDPATTLIYCSVTDDKKRQAHKQYHAQ